MGRKPAGIGRSSTLFYIEQGLFEMVFAIQKDDDEQI